MRREIEKLAASGRLRIAVMGAMCLGAILYGGTKSGGDGGGDPGGDRGGAGRSAVREAGSRAAGGTSHLRTLPTRQLRTFPEGLFTNALEVTDFQIDHALGTVYFETSWDTNLFDYTDSRDLHLFSSTNLLEERWAPLGAYAMPEGTNSFAFEIAQGDVREPVRRHFLDALGGIGFFRFGMDFDSDGDGLADAIETLWTMTDPQAVDSDFDGLTDGEELELGTDPLSGDTDGDWLDDIDEVAFMRTDPDIPWFTDCQWHEVLHASNIDTNVYMIPLPFALTLDGQYCDKLAFDINGALHFGTVESLADVAGADEPQDISSPAFVPRNAVVAPYWTDILTRPGGTSMIRTASVTVCGQEYFVVQALGLCFKVPGVGWCSYQIAIPRLSPATDIFVRYGDTTDSRTSSYTSLGAASASGRVRLAHSFGTGRPVSAGDQILYHFGTGGDPLVMDTDGDGLDDDEEISFGANPRLADTDMDGLPDVDETQSYETAPYLVDTDADSLPDAWEVLHGLDPLSPSGVDGPSGDPDGDGFTNAEELGFGTSPVLADTDGDGLSDPQEVPRVTAQSGFTWSQNLSGTVCPEMHSSNMDSGIWTLGLPFDARLAGRVYDRAAIDLEGVVRLGRGSSLQGVQSSSLPLDFAGPAIDATNLVIGAYWSDLKAYAVKGSNIATARMQYFGVDSYVVEYYGLGFAQGASSGNLRMRVIVPNGSPSNTVYVGYSWVADLRSGASVSVGAQTPDGRIRLPVSRANDTGVASGTLLRYHFGTGGDPCLADTDSDGLDDLEEFQLGTDPRQPDTDGDGLLDWWEAQYGLDPLTDNSTDLDLNNDADADWDGDGLTNAEECGFGTDPRGTDLDEDGIADGYDTDGDGVSDGAETLQGSDPADGTDGGVAGSRTQVQLLFGDPSGSHSEKYALHVVPRSGSGGRPRSLFWVNRAYGECETVTAMLKPGWSYDVTLVHAGTKYGETPDYDYTLSCTAPSNVIVDDPDGLLVSDYTSSVFAGAGKTATIYVLGWPRLVFDYDRNGEIDENDIADASTNRVFRFWINDDNDSGDENSSENDRPGSGPNCADSRVNGRCDLLDFTPVWIDMSQALPANAPPSVWNSIAWKLRSQCAKVIWTALDRSEAGAFHRTDAGPYFGHMVAMDVMFADVEDISQGESLDSGFLAEMAGSPDKGVFLIEGSASGEDIFLEGFVGNGPMPAVSASADIQITSVTNMYWFHSLRGAESAQLYLLPESNPPAAPITGMKDRDVFFLHGFNVGAEDAHAWGSEMFKRLWQSGSNSRFHMVAWAGDYNWLGEAFNGLHYQQDVYNALKTGSALKMLVEREQTNVNSRVLMAHSLGNMAACEALRLGLEVGKYFMFDAAVASETVDGTLQAKGPTDEAYQKYVPSDWYGYTNLCWAANWYRWFESDPSDSRGNMGWPDCFNAVLGNAGDVYNYYSSGDPIPSGDPIFMERETVPDVSDGVFHWPTWQSSWPFVQWDITTEAYSWQKQETHKGVEPVAGTLKGGWGFYCWVEVLLGQPCFFKYSASEASVMVADGTITNNPVFHCAGTQMDNPDATINDIYMALAKYVPAVSSPIGGTDPLSDNNFNLNDTTEVSRPNGWGRDHNVYEDSWLHSDMKDMSYFYVYKLYKQLVTKGVLQ